MKRKWNLQIITPILLLGVFVFAFQNCSETKFRKKVTPQAPVQSQDQEEIDPPIIFEPPPFVAEPDPVDPPETIEPECPDGMGLIPGTVDECAPILTVYSFHQASTQGICGVTIVNLQRCQALTPEGRAYLQNTCQYHTFVEQGTCLSGYNCPVDAYPSAMAANCGNYPYSHEPAAPAEKCVMDEDGTVDTNCLQGT